MLFTLCRPCAAKLQIFETLLPALGARPCAGCGTTVGYEVTRQKAGDIQWPLFGRLIAPYTHFWQWAAWPIDWGIALQDRYGEHVHEWSTNYADFTTGARRDSCRCKEQRTHSVAPTVRPESRADAK